MLPYYIGNTIEQREALFLQTPTSFGDRFNVDVRNNQEVISIDPNKKSVQVKRANGKIYEETYDKLLLSPGANPFIPKIEGVDSEGIFTLRNVEDTDRIKNYAINHKIQHAVVIGAVRFSMHLYSTFCDLMHQKHLQQQQFLHIKEYHYPKYVLLQLMVLRL